MQTDHHINFIILVSVVHEIGSLSSVTLSLPPDAGGGYNWMAPSLQSQDISFTMGTSGTAGSQGTSESQQSSLLFSLAKMKPPSRRPPRAVGENFGKGRLKPDDATSKGK